jgi:hypothetical protein
VIAIEAIPADSLLRQAWKRGHLRYKLHAGQKLLDQTFTKLTSQLFVLNISRQYGKSFYAVTKCIELAIKKPRSRIKYGTAYQTDLVEFIIPTFETVLQDCPIDIKPKYKVQGSKFVFPNGSEIKLVGLDKSPNSLRGNVIDLIVIDEAGFVDNLSYIYKSIIVPATLHRPNCKILFISTPPSTPGHPFGEFIQKAELEGGYAKFTIYDNPRITEADVERMAREVGGRHSTTFRREFLCELILDDDLAIVREWVDDYAVLPQKPDTYHLLHKYVAMDLGRKDKTLAVFGYYDFQKACLVIEDELQMIGSTWTTVTLATEIKEKERKLWGDQKPHRRISDNNNSHLIMDLNSLHEVYFIETNKESLEAMVNEVRIMVGQGRIKVAPHCHQLLGCLKYGIWDKNRKQFSRSDAYGHFDALAALIYLVRNLDRHTNPIPSTFGHTNHQSWTRGANKSDTSNYSNIGKALRPKKAF